MFFIVMFLFYYNYVPCAFFIILIDGKNAKPHNLKYVVLR